MTIPSSNDRPVRAKLRGSRGLKFGIVTIALSIAVFSVIWKLRDDPAPMIPKDTAPVHASKILQKPGTLGLPQARTIVEYGALVYSIRTIDEGDEVLIDVATGKLLSVRDHKGLVIWGPRGKASPMNTSETIKGS